MNLKYSGGLGLCLINQTDIDTDIADIIKRKASTVISGSLLYSFIKE